MTQKSGIFDTHNVLKCHFWVILAQKNLKWQGALTRPYQMLRRQNDHKSWIFDTHNVLKCHFWVIFAQNPPKWQGALTWPYQMLRRTQRFASSLTINILTNLKWYCTVHFIFLTSSKWPLNLGFFTPIMSLSSLKVPCLGHTCTMELRNRNQIGTLPTQAKYGPINVNWITYTVC